MQLIEKNRDLPKEQQQAALGNFLKGRPQPQSRLFLGRKADHSVALILKDPEGRDRIVLNVGADGTPSLQFLDASGTALNAAERPMSFWVVRARLSHNADNN